MWVKVEGKMSLKKKNGECWPNQEFFCPMGLSCANSCVYFLEFSQNLGHNFFIKISKSDKQNMASFLFACRQN